jgi:methylenetetrahydrofolate--tRNA-(uracil-5-)-methyltransferase
VPSPILIIGGGLSGSECALQLSARGIAVELWEQRPLVATEAHRSADFAELVCSNSFKSSDPLRAPGLLKEELRLLGSRLLPIAEACAIPGGAALVVDRERFAREVTRAVESAPGVSVARGEFAALPAALASGRIVVLASGPLTGSALWEQICALVGDGGAYFYDATAPVIEAGSVDTSIAFAQSRYDKGGGDDYHNCPFNKDEFVAFREALLGAEQYPLSAGDSYKLFEGCLPIEELAARGEDTMRFGPLKPKGLSDPRTGRMPYAAAQLRWEDALQSAMSLVGFQTRMRFGEQERVLRLIPGLVGAKFMRFGRMHRNSYLDAPRVMRPTLQLSAAPKVVIAGQLTGLEGYVSAVATGLWAGLQAARLAAGEKARLAPEGSCLGSMLRYATNPAHKDYAPTGFQFGMLTWLPERLKPPQKQALIRERAEAAWAEMRPLAAPSAIVAA